MGDYLKEHVNHFITGLQIAARSYMYALHIINSKAYCPIYLHSLTY